MAHRMGTMTTAVAAIQREESSYGLISTDGNVSASDAVADRAELVSAAPPVERWGGLSRSIMALQAALRSSVRALIQANTSLSSQPTAFGPSRIGLGNMPACMC